MNRRDVLHGTNDKQQHSRPSAVTLVQQSVAVVDSADSERSGKCTSGVKSTVISAYCTCT